MVSKNSLLIEQTFFCAINPSLRSKYVTHSYKLLNKNGKISGILFDVPLNQNHPPFGGKKEEYLRHFSPFFEIQIIDNCYNSEESRAGREL